MKHVSAKPSTQWFTEHVNACHYAHTCTLFSKSQDNNWHARNLLPAYQLLHTSISNVCMHVCMQLHNNYATRRLPDVNAISAYCLEHKRKLQ